ncbi:MAG: oxidoreductase domain-containing protein [Rhodobacteraceae bacterium]|nr:MAG: oxidoreductase domain-containing protein [Paracoccaceae bacterium]
MALVAEGTATTQWFAPQRSVGLAGTRRFWVMGTHGMAKGVFVHGFLTAPRATAATSRATTKPQGTVMKGARYGADHLIRCSVTAYLHDRAERLQVSILDGMKSGIAAIVLDQVRTSGQIVDLTDTCAKLDARGLRK